MRSTFFLLSLLAAPAFADDGAAPEPVDDVEELGIADEGDELGIADEGDDLGIGDEESAEGEDLGIADDEASPPAAAYQPTTRISLDSDSALSVDRAHDAAAPSGHAEDFFEGWSGLKLRLHHKPKAGRSWRIGVRMKLWGGVDHPDEGGTSKTVLLTELRELRYDRRVGDDLVLQLGLQQVDWSVTDGMGPSVMFAPMDLRFGLAGDPDEMRLPVEAAVARYTISYRRDAHIELAFVPRHRPASMRLWGNDWGMLSPRGGGALPMGDIAWAIDPSVEDDWQSNLMAFAKPELKASDFSGALRVRGRAMGAQLGLWAFYGYDAIPELRMDPDMALMLRALTGMGSGPLLEQLTPEMMAAMERFNLKIAEAREAGDGSTLITSVFHRLAQLGAQARRTWGPFVFAFETAWTPKIFGGRTLYDPAMQAVSGLATLHSVFQLEYQAPPDWLVVLSVGDLYVPGVGDQVLMMIDAGFVEGGELKRPFAPEDAHLVTATAAIKHRLMSKLDAMLVLTAHPFAGDYMASPRLTWLLDDEKQELSVSADVFGGPEGTMFGMFEHNDRFVVGYKRRY